MFNVFDILVPALALGAGLDVRPRETAFGLTEDRFAYVGGLEFAKVLPASIAYTDVSAWTGAADRGAWTVLQAQAHANQLVDDDDGWKAFLDALVLVLRVHDDWRVTCESDCDQAPLENVSLSPEQLSVILDGWRRSAARCVALRATPA
jgi:hypothetical protein